jgi:hypothetical protein
MRRTIWLIGLICAYWLCGEAGAAGAATPTSQPLDWRIGPTAWSFNRFTFFEALDKTAQLGLHCIEAFEGQRLSQDIA